MLSNRSHEKLPHISDLLLQIEVQWALLRLSYDLKGISAGEFKVLSEKLSEIGKQVRLVPRAGIEPARPCQGSPGFSYHFSFRGLSKIKAFFA